MSIRFKIADWIGGGALTRANNLAFMCAENWAKSVSTLRDIAAMETPNANATVKRMANVARDALK